MLQIPFSELTDVWGTYVTDDSLVRYEAMKKDIHAQGALNKSGPERLSDL